MKGRGWGKIKERQKGSLQIERHLEYMSTNCNIWSLLGSTFELLENTLESLNAEWTFNDIKELLIF